MNLGDTLRFIRTKKDIKQKEMLPNHQDSSTYSRIENNQRFVKLNDLATILKQLNIQSEEFFSLTSLDDHQETFNYLYYYCGNHPNNKASKKKLLDIYYQIDSKTYRNIQEISNYYAIKCYFHTIWEEVSSITLDEINVIYSTLSNTKYYFCFEYKLLSNLISFFNPQQTKILIQKAYPIKDEDNRDYTTKKFAYNTLINAITVTLYNKDYDSTRKYIKIAKTLDKSNSNYSYRMNLKYLENLTDWLLTGEIKYMQQINNFITILSDIGDTTHANNIKQEVKELTHSKDSNENVLYAIGLIKES
ncbi:transcriptional regulator [Enterococcus ureilyticus]|uniref:Transcriptional regulator n=1 Tax=Enterococcus ureilyticus TaxID=1131292 RepID=A0A1E5H9L5_9ENTE|nr:helix-turn-helix transcriptional regulator [Enterococcus ureilyticus]MBM7688412.1 transcriptional regulator with XRE-family HTH domain [Enterococcus ureilyticus]OEG21516.1 transcriptional regulator [Enterococcus ureilyticus]